MLPELKPRPGGKFSLANPKSEVDWQIERAKKQPGAPRRPLVGPVPRSSPASRLMVALPRSA
jgi:hypothetical protein